VAQSGGGAVEKKLLFVHLARKAVFFLGCEDDLRRSVRNWLDRLCMTL